MQNVLDSGIGETFGQVEYPAKIRRIRLGKYPNYALPSHWHDDVEFLVVTSGSLICDVNGEAVHLECDEGIFINSRQFFGEMQKKLCGIVIIVAAFKRSRPRVVIAESQYDFF